MENTMATYISQEDFHRKLSDYLSTGKSADVHTKKDIRKIIRCLQKKTSKIKLYEKKYRCDPTNSVLLLKHERKSIPVVPKEDYFQTLYEAHILSGHSGAPIMINQLKLYCHLPDFVVDLFVDCCVVCSEEKREKFLSLVKSKQCSCVDRSDFEVKLSKFLDEETEIGFKFISKKDLDYLVKMVGSSQDSIVEEPLEFRTNEHGIETIFWKFNEGSSVEIVSYEDLYYYLSVAHENSQHGDFLEMKILLDSKYFIPNRAVQVFLDLASCRMRRSQMSESRHRSQSQAISRNQPMDKQEQFPERSQADFQYNRSRCIDENRRERSPSLFSDSQATKYSQSPVPSELRHEAQRFNSTSDFDFTPQRTNYSQRSLELSQLEDIFEVDKILQALDTRPDLQLRSPTPVDRISISSEGSNFLEADSSNWRISIKEEPFEPRTPAASRKLSVYDPLKEFNDEGEILLIKLRTTLNIPGVLLYRDLATEFSVLRVLKNSCSRADIAIELWKIFTNFGFPSKLQTEGTKEFTLDIIEELYKLYPDNGVTMNHNAVKRPIYNRKTKDHIRYLIDQWLVDNQSNDLDMACLKVQWIINTSKKVFDPCPFSGVFKGKSGFVHENPSKENFFKSVGFTYEKLSQTDFVESDSSEE